jgi:hypothetical protein
VKAKLSITLDASLVRVLDRLPGPSRSAKLAQVLRQVNSVRAEIALRRALSAASESDEQRAEREAWAQAMEHDQWSESAEGTSGSSSSPRTRSPGRPSS